jgi:5-hydroxyisourate hydrolase-like protein (transthyretin family)
MRRLVMLCATAVVFSCTYPPETLQLTRPPEVTEPTSTVTVHGVVTDVSGRPLADVQVEIAGPGDTWGDRGHDVRTNTEGAYTLSTLLSARSERSVFAVRATLTGYAEQVVETRLVDGLEVDFKLSPTP